MSAPSLVALRPRLRDAAEAALEGRRLSDAQALALAEASGAEHPALWAAAAALRERGRPRRGDLLAQGLHPPHQPLPGRVQLLHLRPRRGRPARAHHDPGRGPGRGRGRARRGCKEALFCLGDRPEARWPRYRETLRRFGHTTTHGYLVDMCRRVLEQTGLLPHPNAGVLSRRELAELREVSPSQGLMLETTAERLCGPGGPHEHAPDKRPATRLAMIDKAGELGIPFTSGILIGIGETARERVEALLALRALHERHGHLQEVIVQNFRAKPDTPMGQAGEPGLLELMSACAIARLVLGRR